VKGISGGSGVRVEAGGESLISSAGGSLLLQTAALSGRVAGLSRALGPWRPARSLHDPGKTVLDLAVAIALGGDCLADVAVLRAQPELFGAVASDPTISRLMEALGEDPVSVVAAIRSARAAARERVWGHRCPVDADAAVIIDGDATLVEAHSEKQGASAHRKHGFGFHPLLAFVDHGAGGTGEPLVGMLRPGRAAANTAADHIAVLDAALAQLPEQLRSPVLVRGDTGAGVHEFVWHMHDLGLRYSVGVYGRQPIVDALAAVPKQAWRNAREPDGRIRDGAPIAELTGWLPATFRGWPPGTRIIARRERPHPGAQLHITDHEGWRITVFATNTGGRLVDLELRHRLRARAEDRIRGLKDTGLTNLPLHAFAKNQIWLELVQLAAELITWTQLLAWRH
jgi:Transposase DDE domain group 1